MGSSRKEPLVILDNTVLTNFALVQRPHLVIGLWPGAVCTTQEVQAEYQAGVRVAGLLPEAWKDLPCLELTESEMAFSLSLPHRLGAGERSCLAVAVNRNSVLATDDREARQYAQRAGVTVAGTVGILVRAVQMGLVGGKEAQELLERMIAAGYHSPIQGFDEIL